VTTIDKLLTELNNLKLKLWGKGDCLWYETTKENLTPSLLQDLKDHKQELLDFFKAPESSLNKTLWFLEQLESQLSYWKKQLADIPPLLELPTDYPRPAIQTLRREKEYFGFNQHLTTKLKNLSQEKGILLLVTLLAAWAILLSRYSHQEELIIGSPIANQNSQEIEGLNGLWVNHLPLRIKISPNQTFTELLNLVEGVVLEAYNHQDLPYEKIVEALQPEKNLSYHPLFQVMLVVQTNEGGEIEGLKINTLETAKLDLTLSITETTEGLRGSFEYNRDLFNPDRITRLVGHFETLLSAIVVNPEQEISQLPLLTEAERHQILVEWNQTQTDYLRDKCIHECFEDQVELTPEAVAVVLGEQQITYRELNNRANQLAHYLQKLGVKPEVLVGICLERSIEMIVGLLGILKAGRAYVPLDVNYPLERLAYMLEVAQVSVILTQQSLVEKLPETQTTLVYLDSDWETFQLESTENLGTDIKPDNLAYVIYTSGSTGKPKGVAILQQGVVRLVKQTNYVNLTSEEVFLQLAPISFDASTFEIWGSLLNGAKLVLYPSPVPSLEELGKILKLYQITTLWLTSAFFNLMVDERLEDLKLLRQLLAGGDVLSLTHVKKVISNLSNCRLINGYGPTENTTFTCCYPVTRLDQLINSVPIGRPISNTQVYILDKQLRPVPIGVSGELYTGGDGLARGYLNRPELTQEKFIPHPFIEGERLYKTGDLARYIFDGNIEYIGRIDNQVKIRGFRIELGEIETVLNQHPDIRQSLVMVREDLPGDKRLVAYLVTEAESKLSSNEYRTFISSKLPNYMLPSALVFLEAFPLTPNGKIDRKALPVPDLTRQEPEETFVSPRDQLELELTQIWERVLGINPIGINDNFFDLGGNSLLAVKLLTQIENVFKQNLPLAAIFQVPTIRQLAELLRSPEELNIDPYFVPIQPRGTKPPFFLCGGAVLYKTLSDYLGSEQPVYGLITDDGQGKLTLQFNHIEELAAHHIEIIKTLQPEGPYFLGGLSFGGVIAFEMAQQLSAQGQKVALLALFDTLKPGALQKFPLHRQIQYYINQPFKILLEKIQQRIIKTYSRLAMKNPVFNLKNLEHLVRQEAFFQEAERYSKNYIMQNYYQAITLFVATKSLESETFQVPPGLGWLDLAVGGLEIHEIPGDHMNILQEPYVQVLAEKLQSSIAQALIQ